MKEQAIILRWETLLHLRRKIRVGLLTSTVTLNRGIRLDVEGHSTGPVTPDLFSHYSSNKPIPQLHNICEPYVS